MISISASVTLVSFLNRETERKIGGWRKENKKNWAFLQYLYLCIVKAAILDTIPFQNEDQKWKVYLPLVGRNNFKIM